MSPSSSEAGTEAVDSRGQPAASCLTREPREEAIMR